MERRQFHTAVQVFKDFVQLTQGTGLRHIWDAVDVIHIFCIIEQLFGTTYSLCCMKYETKTLSHSRPTCMFLLLVIVFVVLVCCGLLFLCIYCMFLLGIWFFPIKSLNYSNMVRFCIKLCWQKVRKLVTSTSSSTFVTTLRSIWKPRNPQNSPLGTDALLR